MKKSTIVTIILIAAAVVLGVIFISWYLRKATPLSAYTSASSRPQVNSPIKI